MMSWSHDGWARKRFSLTHISILIARLSFWKQGYILNMTLFCLANKPTADWATQIRNLVFIILMLLSIKNFKFIHELENIFTQNWPVLLHSTQFLSASSPILLYSRSVLVIGCTLSQFYALILGEALSYTQSKQLSYSET